MTNIVNEAFVKRIQEFVSSKKSILVDNNIRHHHGELPSGKLSGHH
jgi:hypothetical protein